MIKWKTKKIQKKTRILRQIVYVFKKLFVSYIHRFFFLFSDRHTGRFAPTQAEKPKLFAWSTCLIVRNRNWNPPQLYKRATADWRMETRSRERGAARQQRHTHPTHNTDTYTQRHIRGVACASAWTPFAPPKPPPIHNYAVLGIGTKLEISRGVERTARMKCEIWNMK